MARRWPSQEHNCPETEADVFAAMDDTGEDGCPVCGLGPEEHPVTLGEDES